MEPPPFISGSVAMARAFSEYADTCTAVATSFQLVFRKLPPSASRGANAIACSTPSSPSTCSFTRPARVEQWLSSATSSSSTGGGSGSRLAIRSTRLIRPYPVSTTVAPSCWATLATWNAIEESVSTPVIRMRLPARIPMVVSVPCPGRRRPG